jgi:PEP-CTERM motif
MYGFYQGTAETLDPAGFNPMTQQLPQGQFGWWAVDFYHLWTSLDAFGGHPNSVNTDLHDAPYCDQVLGNCGSGHDTNPAHFQDFMDQWAVRRYIVPVGFNGMVSITLSVQKDYRTTSVDADGTTNYAILYSGGVATALATINTPTNTNALSSAADPSTFAVQTVTLNVNVQGGDILDFAIAPNANDYSDGEFQLITIQAIPEPATMLLVGGGLLLAGFARRKYSRPS